MADAVIVGAVRTPVGRRKGGLAGIHPVDLSAHVLRALASRAGFDPADNLPAPSSRQLVERSLGGAAENNLHRRGMCL